MEKKLRALFDLQRFEGNADLQQIIDSTHSRYASRELNLDEMETIAAAGTPKQTMKKPGEKDRV